MTLINKDRMLEIAQQLVEEGRLDRAIKEYEKVLEVDPHDLRVKIKIAEIEVRRRRIPEAIKLYRDVAEEYESENFYLKAVTIYKGILKLNPSLIDINEKLAVLYQKMGLISDSVRQYEILAAALEQQGMWEKLIDIRRRILELLPQDGQARVRLAELYQREGRLEEALDEYTIYAKQLEAGGDKVKLAEIYERILPHRMGDVDMLKKLVRIYHERGDNKKVIKWLEAAADKVKDDEDMLEMKAKIYIALRQMESARNVYLALADLYARKGEIKKAIETWLEICFIAPGEEGNAKDVIEGLRPGYWPRFMEKLEQRRRDAWRDEDEDTDTARMEREDDSAVETKTSASQAAGVSAGTVSATKKLHVGIKELEAIVKLGKTYRKMGLLAEALAEWDRAREGFERLASVEPAYRAGLDEVLKLIAEVKKCQTACDINGIRSESGGSNSDRRKKKKISFI